MSPGLEDWFIRLMWIWVHGWRKSVRLPLWLYGTVSVRPLPLLSRSQRQALSYFRGNDFLRSVLGCLIPWTERVVLL